MTRVDAASRVVRADATEVYAALTDRDALEQWLPPSGMTGRFEQFDASPGGSYRLVLTYDDAGSGAGKTTRDSDVTVVRFLALEPNRRLVQAVDFVADDPSFEGTMIMTWELVPSGADTRVDLRAEHVPVGISAEDHARGMASSLDNLAAYVEGDRTA